MRRILTALFIFLCVAAKAQDRVTMITPGMSAVSKLKNVSAGMLVTLPDSSWGGGTFMFVDTAGLTPDNGLVFKIPGINNLLLKRIVKPGEPISIKMFGAKGLGLSSLNEDTTAFVNVFKMFRRISGEKKLYIPSTSLFYCWPPTPTPICDSVEVYGDGKYSTRIVNVAPNRTTFNSNPAFITTTYTPSSKNFINRAPIYDIEDAQKGQSFVKLDNATKADSIIIGKVIAVVSKFFYDDNDTTQPRFQNIELNEVVAKNADTLFLKYDLGLDMLTINSESPHVINLNNTATTTPDFKNYPLVNFTSKSVNIHDLAYYQSDIDLISNKPFSRSLSGVFNPGGCFECSFHDLYIEAYMGAIYGNMFTHTKFYNITQKVEGHSIDMGFGSYDVDIHDNETIFKDFKNSDSRQTDIIINDGQHSIFLYRNKFSGNRTSDNRLIGISGVKNIYIRSNDFNYPYYKAGGNSMIEVIDGNNTFSKDIYIIGNSTLVDSVKQFVYVSGIDSFKTDSTKNVTISGNQFFGKVVNNALFVSGVSGLDINNLNFSKGIINISNVRNSTFSNLISDSVIISGDTTKTDILNVLGKKNIAAFTSQKLLLNNKVLTSKGLYSDGDATINGSIKSAAISGINNTLSNVGLSSLTTATNNLLKGNGTTVIAATPGTDYITPTGTETITNKTINGSNNTLSNVGLNALTTATSNLLKGNGTTVVAATPGTDYITPTGTATLTNKTINGSNNTLSNVGLTSLSTASTTLLKGNGTTVVAATPGTDYITPTGIETITNKTVNGSNNTLSNVGLTSLTTAATTLLKGNGTTVIAATPGTDYITPAGTTTLTNKTINGSNNTVSNVGLTSLTTAATTLLKGNGTTVVAATPGVDYLAAESYQSLTYASSVTVDYTAGTKYYTTLTGDMTIDFSNFPDGGVMKIIFKQDASGNHVVTFPANTKAVVGTFATGTSNVNLSTAGNDEDDIEITKQGSNYRIYMAKTMKLPELP